MLVLNDSHDKTVLVSCILLPCRGKDGASIEVIQGQQSWDRQRHTVAQGALKGAQALRLVISGAGVSQSVVVKRESKQTSKRGIKLACSALVTLSDKSDNCKGLSLLER